MELTGRARIFAIALTDLSRRKGVSGRGALVDRGARYISLGVRLNNELQINDAIGLAEPLALATNTRVVVAKREAGLVVFQFELARNLWEKYTRSDLRTMPGVVGLGFGDGHKQVNFQFTHAAPHTGVFGTTGSGKSETVKSLLCGLFTAYTPDELGAIIVDPDGDYVRDFRNVAHLEYPIARRGTEIDYVLSRAGQELQERRYSTDSGRCAKRLVILIDEAEDVLHGKRLDLALAISKRGRKRNVNLIAATQKPTQKTLPDLMPEINNRYVGLVSDGRVSAYLTGHAGLECHKLTGEGDFVHVAYQERLLVALATRVDYDRLPRCEVGWEDGVVPTPEFSDDNEPEEEERKPGRPPTQMDPKKIAFYMHRGHPEGVTILQARDELGLARYAHYAHRDFAQELIAELLRLRQLMRGTT